MNCEDCDYCYIAWIDEGDDWGEACEKYGKWIYEIEDCPVWHEKEETP
jgi:hypothetical protein